MNNKPILALCLAFLAVGGVEGLQCEVGLGGLAKELNCTGSYDSLRTKISSFGGNITNVGNLFSSSRRRRETDEEAKAEPVEDENTYYCLTHSLAGINVKSCAPKGVLGIDEPKCKDHTVGKTCACNTNLCNSASVLSIGGAAVVGLFSLLLVEL